jgi:CubicO group peptidase (beta-lactamase class C family)
MKFRFCLFLLISLVFVSSVQAFENKVIEKIINEANKKGEFSGVVLIAKDGKVIYEGATGLANRQWNIPNNLNAKFRICSITKQFTSLLIMQLVEQGKVDLDKTIADYLPDFRKETASKVKIRDLLYSASGLPDLPDEFYVNEDAKMTDADFVIKTYLQGDLQFQPGEKFNYNNADFIVLGKIIEKVSGKSFETVLKEKILKPLGMNNTGLLKNEDVIKNLASGYTFKDGKYFNESFIQIQNFGAAGAMYSDAHDLLLWDNALLGKALLNYKILSKKYLDEMFTPSPKLGFVGLGSWVYNLDFADGKKRRLIERQGGINGFSLVNIISPDENLSAIFMGNVETQTLFSTYAKQGLSYRVLNAIFEK